MALKEKPILTCFLFTWLSFIKVRGFVVVNEGNGLDSAGWFNKNARTMELFDRWDEKPKSGAQVGRLLIWEDQASKSRGGAGVSSELGSRSQDENAYQSDDSGWLKLQPLWGQVYGVNTQYAPTVERLLGMKPKVDCVEDLMKLTIYGQESLFGSNFLIDRGSNPPLPLSQLPSECGHRLFRTWRGLVFVIPYDGCYVIHERDTFVLPLLWGSLPVKLSCSSLTSAKSEPTISCYTNGMIVRLHGGVSEKLKIKVMDEWQPLLKVSAKCGYSLVSHPEGVVIHAPYMPCTKPKDGMFTLSMVVESEFNLSCPALSLSLPIDMPDLAQENEPISITQALPSTLPPTTITTIPKTTQPRPTPPKTSTSSVKKLPTPPLPYYFPGQPDFRPFPPRYPFPLFPLNIPPTIPPKGPKIEGPETAITQKPQAPIYIKRPQTLYPWYPNPSLGLPRDPTHESAAGPPYPRKPLLPPTKAPSAPIAPVLKSTGSPQDKLTFTVPVLPPMPWPPMFPPRNMVYPLYPGKPEFVTPSSPFFPPDPYWPHHPQIQQRLPKPHAPPKPELKPPKPAPTRKTGPDILPFPWYKPFPPRRSEMPPVPKNNPGSTSEAVASTTNSEKSEQVEKTQASELSNGTIVKGPPKILQFDFTPDTEPTPSRPKCPVCTPAPTEASSTPICSSNAHCVHCPTLCPGPPSMFYHHHNHHHFGHPFQMSNFDISSSTKITGQMLSSPAIPPDSNLLALLKGMGYNYFPLDSKTPQQPASDGTAMQYLVENPLVKNTAVTDASRHFTWPFMCPYLFSKWESTAASTPPTIKPVNSEPSKNRSVAETLAYSNHSPDPAVNQAEMQLGDTEVSPVRHDPEQVLVAPNVPSFTSLKPTPPPTHGKNAFMNYWYQAANLNAKPPRSNSLTKDYFTQMSIPQPPSNHNSFEPSTENPDEETRDGNPPAQLSFLPSMQIHDSVPVMNPQLYLPPNLEPVNPVFSGPNLFNTHWVPAVQPDKNGVLSSSQTDGYMGHPSTVD